MSRTPDGLDRVQYPPGFGNVGANRVVRESGRYVVLRTLDTSDFQVLPLQGQYFPWVKGNDGTWKAVCPGSEPPSAAGKWGTLYDLVCRVRRKMPMKFEDKDLQLLRRVLVGLLNAVQSIHQQTPDDGPSRLGLLDPTNILYWVDTAGEPTVCLPDAGFRWSGWLDAPKHLTEARWAGKPKECEIFSRLWGEQSLVDAQRGATKASETEALARLFGWIISGEIRTSVPTKFSEGANEDELHAWKSLAPFLSVGNKRYTFMDLAKAYGAAPLWASFASGKSTGVRLPLRRVLSILAVLLLLGLLVTFAVFREEIGTYFQGLITRPTPPLVPSDVCPECKEGDPYFEELKKISGVDGSYHLLENALTKGAIGDSVVEGWIATDKELTVSQALEIKTDQFEKMFSWIESNRDVLKSLKAIQKDETPDQKVCRERLEKQLRIAVENTARVMAWTNSKMRTVVHNGDRLRRIVKEFIELLPELKEEKPWPKYPF